MNVLDFIISKRLIIFFDEWLFYLLLSYVYYIQEDLAITTLVAILGTLFMTISYYHHHQLEIRFLKLYQKECQNTNLKLKPQVSLKAPTVN